MMLAPARFGFDESRVTFAIRTSIAACVALLVAWMLGLEHPQWAAMSVWAASQPLREQLLAKGFYRVMGTIVGTLVGVLLVQAYEIEPALLVVGLAAWVGLCTWGTNLQRGFTAYATVLAGYTAAMVSLLDIGNTAGVFGLAADRLATVLTGVLVATVAGLAFAPRGVTGAGLRAQVRELVASVLERMAEQARKGESVSPDAEVIARIAGIEEGLDSQFPGARRETRTTRAILIAAMAVMFQRGQPVEADSTFATHLSAAAALLKERRTPEACTALLAAAEAAQPYSHGAYEALSNLAEALAAWAPKAAQLTRVKPMPVILHRDWVGARQAALRAIFALGSVGAAWLLTGWSSGQFMLLGLSIMISLFSTFENPAKMMTSVIYGQIVAIAAVFVCRWLIWPHLDAEWELVVSLLPFILFGSVLVAHTKAAAISFDYNMVFLLLMQPNWPLEGSPLQTGLTAAGVLLGPVVALAIYRFVFPTDLRSRKATLIQMMQRDLMDMAAEPEAWHNRTVWRARLYHRTLRLIRLQERLGKSRASAVARAEEHLQLGHQIMQLHRALASENLTSHQARAFTTALARMENLQTRPQKALDSMAFALRHLR